MIQSMILKNLLNNGKVIKKFHRIPIILFVLGIPVDEQRLTLGGISLDDELTLDECHIEEESTLYVLLDLEGGGKKRKKKTYSTPKKNKHKRKKVKLAVLKYYKVK
jgi:small subunit ribosomal protein S27Ae